MSRRFWDILWFIVENIPSVFTVIFAAYVLLRNQQTTIAQQDILVWILTLIGLLATSELIERIRRLKHIEDTSLQTLEMLTEFVKQDSLRHRQSGIRLAYNSREFNRILELVPTTRNEILLLGSTIYTTLNLIRTTLIETLVRTNPNVKILLSDSSSQFLLEKEDEENTPGKNQAEVIASLTILQEIAREIEARGYKGSFEVRQYNRIAYFSLYIFDQSIALSSLYSFGRRSVELPMMEVENASRTANSLFKMYEDHFRKLWADSRTKTVIILPRKENMVEGNEKNRIVGR